MTLKDLVTLNKRDYIGLVCWFIVSALIGGLTFPIMITREIYQYRKYSLPRFEWEDVIRYGIVLLLGSGIHYWLLSLLLN